MSREQTWTFTVRRSWVAGALGLVLGFAGGYLAATVRTPDLAAGSAPEAPGNPPSVTARSSATAAAAVPPVEMELAGRPARGPADAPVTIVEFTDYQCPFCARHHRETKAALLEAYPGKLRYVVRNFPIRSIHPLAQKAAEAAECAHDQDGFWEYADLLYRRAPALQEEALIRYAGEAGLDVEQLRACLDSGEKEGVVNADLREGRRHGVRSTPTFFINGRRILGAKPLAEFRARVDAALSGADTSE